jgi:triosephosphate isomerase
VIAPPAIFLLFTKDHIDNHIQVAAQNVFDQPNGAFTGEISVEQLKESDIHWVIIGHSERRTLLGERDNFVASKTAKSVQGGLSVILCIGESLEEREAGKTIDIVTKQLAAVASVTKDWTKIVIAYEPIWYVSKCS